METPRALRDIPAIQHGAPEQVPPARSEVSRHPACCGPRYPGHPAWCGRRYPRSGSEVSPRAGASTPAPGASTPTPGASTPTPGANTPTPGASTPTPGASTPTPGASTPAPGASTPAPGASTPPSRTTPIRGRTFHHPTSRAPSPGIPRRPDCPEAHIPPPCRKPAAFQHQPRVGPPGLWNPGLPRGRAAIPPGCRRIGDTPDTPGVWHAGALSRRVSRRVGYSTGANAQPIPPSRRHLWHRRPACMTVSRAVTESRCAAGGRGEAATQDRLVSPPPMTR